MQKCFVYKMELNKYTKQCKYVIAVFPNQVTWLHCLSVSVQHLADIYIDISFYLCSTFSKRICDCRFNMGHRYLENAVLSTSGSEILPFDGVCVCVCVYSFILLNVAHPSSVRPHAQT